MTSTSRLTSSSVACPPRHLAKTFRITNLNLTLSLANPRIYFDRKGVASQLCADRDIPQSGRLRGLNAIVSITCVYFRSEGNSLSLGSARAERICRNDQASVSASVGRRESRTQGASNDRLAYGGDGFRDDVNAPSLHA